MDKSVYGLGVYISNLFAHFYFIMKVLQRGNFKNEIKKTSEGNAVVLANGPSLKKELPLMKERYKDADFVVMNMFALSEYFLELKPKHYCFADPMFYHDYTPQLQQIKETFRILNEKVDWKMTIYAGFSAKNGTELFKAYSNITNKNITFITVKNTIYRGPEVFRNFYYTKNLSIPVIANVSILSVYVALMNGYKNIYVYGIDHDLCHNFYVNDDNQFCISFTHFYDKDNNLQEKLMPWIPTVKGESTKVARVMRDIHLQFASHDELEDLSHLLHAKIWNCTKPSLVDSYERRKH